MNTKTLKLPALSAGIMALVVAVGVFASIAMFAHADTAPTLTTTAYNSSNAVVTTATIGTNVFATAVIASSSTTTAPTGSVTFNRYDNTSCTGTATTQAGVVMVNGIATSSAASVGASGLSYKASYSGDTFNPSVVGTCYAVAATASATTLTSALSSTSVFAGSSVNETSTLGGATASAGGSVAYAVYSNNACTTLWQNAGTKSVTSAIVPASDSVVFATPGTYWWRGVYSGDASNAAATSSCLSLAVAATTSPAAAMISGTVYNDANANFAKDGGELGVSGFTVRLHSGPTIAGALLATASTDSNGNYSFPSLANGTYSIELAPLAPWQQETADYLAQAVANQSSLANLNFAVHNPATTTPPAVSSISGTVYNDANKNDMRDASEAGLAGFTINLYKNAGWWGKNGNNNPIQTVVTDANGFYTFNNLANGTYSVEEIKKAGWKQTSSDYKSLTLTNGAGLSGKDFANVAKATTTPKGNHGDGDNDNDDNATSSNHGGKGNNGNHWGWFKNGNGKGWHFGWGKDN